MNKGLENYLAKVKELEGMFPGIRPTMYDVGITPHDMEAKVEYPALECNKVIFNVNDRQDIWWFHLIYRAPYEGNFLWISVNLLRITGRTDEWNDWRHTILKHVELLSENEMLSDVEAELALATYRVYDARYSK